MLRYSTRRGKAPANIPETMFCLVYSGEGAAQPLVDDPRKSTAATCQLVCVSILSYHRVAERLLQVQQNTKLDTSCSLYQDTSSAII